MLQIILYILLGLLAGVLSGLLGIGGAVIIIPILVYFFGLSQCQAQGTTLALMVPPIGLLAAWIYFRQGYVDLKIAAFICLGFFAGGLLGATVAVNIPPAYLRKIFGVSLLLISLHMMFFK